MKYVILKDRLLGRYYGYLVAIPINAINSINCSYDWSLIDNINLFNYIKQMPTWEGKIKEVLDSEFKIIDKDQLDDLILINSIIK